MAQNRSQIFSVRVLLKLIFFVLILFVTQNAIAQESNVHRSNLQDSNVINWHLNHKPPSSFLNGPHRGTGFIDKVLHLIQKQLTDYEHRHVHASFAQTINDLEAGEFVCHPALVKNQNRESFIAFSQMSVMHPSNHITLPLNLVAQLKIKHEVDLRELLDNEALILGLESGRSYGAIIDNTISNYGINTTMTFKAGKSLTSLYTMLTRQRVDYLIGYPFEAYFALETLEKSDTYRSFPILGTPHFTMGAVGCVNNAWGQTVIAEVNQALDKLKATPEYQHALTFWLEDFVVNDRFEHYYQEIFLNN